MGICKPICESSCPHRLDQQTCVRLARNDRRTALAAHEHRLARVKPQLVELFVGPVAAITIHRQDGPHARLEKLDVRRRWFPLCLPRRLGGGRHTKPASHRNGDKHQTKLHHISLTDPPRAVKTRQQFEAPGLTLRSTPTTATLPRAATSRAATPVGVDRSVNPASSVFHDERVPERSPSETHLFQCIGSGKEESSRGQNAESGHAVGSEPIPGGFHARTLLHRTRCP